ncbi:MAG: HAD family hydrolase [Micrococcales bacterium]|nr:HAD family hydrolase [Micrococcales bacterium]
MRPVAARPRVVATDLDGTLLDPRGAVTPRTRDALRRMWALGIETVFVTARPPRWLDPLADHVGGHGVVICANGAFVYDVEMGRVVQAVGLELTSVVGIAADVRARFPRVGFAAERPQGPHVESAYRTPLTGLHDVEPPPGLERGPIESVRGIIGKLLARGPYPPDNAFVEEVGGIVGDRGVVAYSGAGGLAEIGPPGVSKATALQTWCDARGIVAREVWAFGDMPNDLPMLAWAGRSFAMANGHEMVRAAADNICHGNDDDGVARVLDAIE